MKSAGNMLREADIAEPRDQESSAARHKLREGMQEQAASTPAPCAKPVEPVPPRSISSVEYDMRQEKQADSLVSDVTALRTSSQSGPELSSGSTQQSAGESIPSWAHQQSLPAAETAQGSGSSSSSGQPGQEQAADSFISPFAFAAAAPAPAGPLASQEAAPAAVLDPLHFPVGTAATGAAGAAVDAAAGAVAVPLQMQPLNPFAAAAAAQPEAAIQDQDAQLAAAVYAFNPFGDAAAGAAAAGGAAAPPFVDDAGLDQLEEEFEFAAWLPPPAWNLFGDAAAGAAAGGAAAADAGFDQIEEEYEFAAWLPPPADAGPGAGQDLQPIAHNGVEFSIHQDVLISTGSFGTVYRGTYINTPVAVKVLQEELSEDHDAVKRRLRSEVEPQLLAQQHAGVVKILAVCFDPPAIVMELCLCSLSERISNQWAAQQPQQQQQQQQQEPSWAVVVDLLGQAAEALTHIHNPNPTIIHNDIRAANILLAASSETEPSPWKLKICDFGLAVQVPPDLAAAPVRVPRHTDSRWVAPEVQADWVEGLGYKVTPAADVYALGCVLYEMMVPSTPAPVFPAAQQRLPALRDNPPAGLERLFAQCVGNHFDRPSADIVWHRVNHIVV